jgi:hypothetical protein
VRCTDGTSRDNDRPCGVANFFQIIEHSVEPMRANRCRNLLSHPDSGPSGTDEAKLVGPQVPLVVGTALLSGNRERLARARARPEFAIDWPSGESRGERPSADASEEMALRVSFDVVGSNIRDAPLVHVATSDMSCGDEIS